MDAIRLRRPAAALLALWAALAGCAYEVAGTSRALAPDRLARMRRVGVAPFRYVNDWTGYFRGVYRAAGAAPPPGKKTDRVEATFLLEDALSQRGYAVVSWPGRAADGLARALIRDAEGRGARLAPLRERGAEAVLAAEGASRCESLEVCTAQVRVRLFGIEGRLLWEGRAEGTSLLAQGDEMRAAVRNALREFPRAPPRGRGAP